VIHTTVQNNDNEISLHFKPMRHIFMNYSVQLPQIVRLLVTWWWPGDRGRNMLPPFHLK